MADWLRRLRSFFVVVLFFGIFLYVLSLNFRTPNRMDFLQKLVVETLAPLVKKINTTTLFFSDLIEEYALFRDLHSENEALKERVVLLEQQITEYREAYVENLRLRRLLDFKATIPAETIPAQVVLHDLTGWFQTLVIDKGALDQIAPDMPVVNDEGVVGRVLDVSDRFSRILLITDPGSSIDAIIQRNRVRGILTGRDANTCHLRYVRSNLDVQVGDLIISSGKDGIFPKGLRLGTVQGVYKDPVDLFLRIDVKPLVRLNALEELLILKREVSFVGKGAGY